MSSASSGCGRPSIRADSMRSTRCTFPSGRPVQLTMISQDVFHSFSVPDFRIKREVIPGRYSTVWFEATTPGNVPHFLHAILRHQPLRHDRRSYCADAGRLPEVAARIDQRHVARAEWRAAVCQHGLQLLPYRRRGRSRAKPGGRLWHQSAGSRMERSPWSTMPTCAMLF